MLVTVDYALLTRDFSLRMLLTFHKFVISKNMLGKLK